MNVEPGTNDLVVWPPAGRIPAPLASPVYHGGNTALAGEAADGEADAAGDGEASCAWLGDEADWQPTTVTSSTAPAAAIIFACVFIEWYLLTGCQHWRCGIVSTSSSGRCCTRSSAAPL